MAKPSPKSNEELTVRSDSSLTLLDVSRQYKKEAMDAKRERMEKNRQNVEVYMGQQDWSHKGRGQSKEFLPKVPVAVEQFSAFIERALVQFGDWYSADLGKSDEGILTPQQIRNLLNCYLDHLPDGYNKTIPFAVRLADAIKTGLLEALVILKVHGYKIEERQFFAERGEKTVLRSKTMKPWRLAIDLVSPKDYFPDPNGRGLYEIHSVERDLHDVEEWAKQGIYETDAIERIEEDYAKELEKWREENARLRGQNMAQPPSFRKRVLIDEFWGDILDDEGHLVKRNALWAVANDKYVIRKPEANPWWHQESPFVAAPLVRVPQTVWHKALYDHASQLNLSLNELFNLMLDGGLASVWGNRQIRLDWLEDVTQVTGGVPQGTTLAVKAETPIGAKVLETVTTGEVPGDAMAMYNLADREFNVSALTNDLKMGLLPPKEVRATEVVEVQQSQAVTLDAISAKIEQLTIAPVLRKSWLCLLQMAEDLDANEVVDAIGTRAAIMLSRMSRAERFARFANRCNFKVHGLSATLARVRDFQKFMALFQSIQANPLLFQAFIKRFSANKALTNLMKFLNINPEHIELDEEEKTQLPQDMAKLPQIAEMLNPSRSMKGELAGGAEVPAEVNQAANPMTGMAGT